ncbi:MAG TPA: hypothetical protein PK031_05815 [Pseudomonadales bacterium]|nr:hypothetical protein [Pseudomonadales bacterium]
MSSVGEGREAEVLAERFYIKPDRRNRCAKNIFATAKELNKTLELLRHNVL